MAKIDGMDPKLVRQLLSQVRQAAKRMRSVDAQVGHLMSAAGLPQRSTHRPAEVADACDGLVRDVTARLALLEKQEKQKKHPHKVGKDHTTGDKPAENGSSQRSGSGGEKPAGKGDGAAKDTDTNKPGAARGAANDHPSRPDSAQGDGKEPDRPDPGRGDGKEPDKPDPGKGGGSGSCPDMGDPQPIDRSDPGGHLDTSGVTGPQPDGSAGRIAPTMPVEPENPFADDGLKIVNRDGISLMPSGQVPDDQTIREAPGDLVLVDPAPDVRLVSSDGDVVMVSVDHSGEVPGEVTVRVIVEDG